MKLYQNGTGFDCFCNIYDIGMESPQTGSVGIRQFENELMRIREPSADLFGVQLEVGLASMAYWERRVRYNQCATVCSNICESFLKFTYLLN